MATAAPTWNAVQILVFWLTHSLGHMAFEHEWPFFSLFFWGPVLHPARWLCRYLFTIALCKTFLQFFNFFAWVYTYTYIHIYTTCVLLTCGNESSLWESSSLCHVGSRNTPVARPARLPSNYCSKIRVLGFIQHLICTCHIDRYLWFPGKHSIKLVGKSPKSHCKKIASFYLSVFLEIAWLFK